MSENGNQSREWNSRFGYIMVAAGAAIGSETFGNSHISPCRESNQNHYACTLSLPYYMCI